MPLGADRPVVLLLLITFTHYLNECTPYHTVRRTVTEWAAAPAEARQPRTEGPLVRQSPEACGGEPALPRRSREIGSTRTTL